MGRGGTPLPHRLLAPAAYALTLFVSAALLFLVQPMLGKLILPRFGGSPAVWNTCVVFFQAVLLTGYAYAHFTTRWLGVRRQAALHLLVLAVALAELVLSRPGAPGRTAAAPDANPVV